MIKHKEGVKKSKREEEVFSTEKWIKRHWLYLAIGAFFIAVLSVGLIMYAFSSHADTVSPAISGEEIPTEDTSGLSPRCLDGILTTSTEACLLPRAVMVENYIEARPLSGLSAASLVFEAPVEGGITRLMAVYDATATVSEIGPVRSARPYYIEWAQALGAIYAHVGGSPEALNRIGGLYNFKNLDEMAGEKYFWRSSSRSAPHNVYISSEALAAAQSKKEWHMSKDFRAWSFTDPDKDFSPGNVASINIPFDGAYKVKWVFDAETNAYERYLGGLRDKEKNGTPLMAKNILALSTDQRVLDDKGRLFIRTTGEGKGWYFSGGEAKEIVWSRKAGEFYKIQTQDGSDVAFLRGNTWIEIVSLPSYEPVFNQSN